MENRFKILTWKEGGKSLRLSPSRPISSRRLLPPGTPRATEASPCPILNTYTRARSGLGRIQQVRFPGSPKVLFLVGGRFKANLKTAFRAGGGTDGRRASDLIYLCNIHSGASPPPSAPLALPRRNRSCVFQGRVFLRERRGGVPTSPERANSDPPHLVQKKEGGNSRKSSAGQDGRARWRVCGRAQKTRGAPGKEKKRRVSPGSALEATQRAPLLSSLCRRIEFAKAPFNSESWIEGNPPAPKFTGMEIIRAIEERERWGGK